MSIRNVLVTGARGFIGRHLCRNLKKRNIVVLGEESQMLDVTDLSELLSVEENSIDAIIHLGAKTSIPNSLQNPHETYYVNFLGTLNLLEFARLRNIRKFINLSTYVYGHPRYLPIDEKHPIDPHTPYNKSKLLAEHLCQFYSYDFALQIVTLRPFSLYGPYTRPSSFLYSVIDQMLKKDGKVRLSGRSIRRDFLFIDDFLELVIMILDSFPPGYNVYNVGFGTSYTLESIALTVARLMDRKIIIEYEAEKPNKNYKEVVDIVADITKVSSAFNWKPHTLLEEGLSFSLKTLT